MKLTLLLSLLFSSSVLADGFIVKLREGTQKSFLYNKSNSALIKELVKDETYLIKTESKGRVHEILENADIEYIEPNYKIFLDDQIVTEEIKDPRFKEQWGLKNQGNIDVNIMNAWKLTKGSRDIKIAVIDTGVDYTHPDLKDQMWINEAEKNGQEGVDDDGNGLIDDIHGYDFVNDDGDPKDDQGHGTHCSGVIGASHNDIGIAGVMGNVQIMALKFLDWKGQGDTANAIKAIDYAIAQKVDIMSNSWGSGKESQALKDAVKRAEEAGILFVVAAGNSSSDNDAKPVFPSNIEHSNVIAVGSHDKYGKRSYFSNYGEKTVHVFAPGTSILSTLPNKRYGKLSGTSMAAPFVSGILGLYLSMGYTVDKTNLESVRERIIQTSVVSDVLNIYSQSHGRVDSLRFLEDLRN